MTDQKFIESLLDINQPMSVELNRLSTISILLRGARKLSGRDLLTGIYLRSEINFENFTDQIYHSNQFSGLINYLIFLEQIGSIFELKSRKKNGIHIALENFSFLSSQQIVAIRALRNSMTHNFGLASEIIPENKGKRHKFTLSIERNANIVSLPKNKWEGDFTDKSEQSNTIIYIIDLSDLVENIYSQLKTEVSSNNIKIALKNGLDELKARFTILTS
jgi:hypothetical protein